MKSQSYTVSRLTNGLALIITGLSIGWMVGMSVSPVVQTVIASVLALLVSVLSLLAGLPSKSDSSPPKESKGLPGTPKVETHALGNVVTVLIANNPPVAPIDTEPEGIKTEDNTKSSTARAPIALWPVAVFILFLAIGSAGGVFTRANNLLGVDAHAVAHKWATNKMDSLLIIKHLYKRTYGDSTAPSVGPLYDLGLRNEAQQGSDCQEAQGLQGVPLWNWLISHANSREDSVRINAIEVDDTLKLNQERAIQCK